MVYFVLKFLHLIDAAVLLGTGAGITFFILAAHIDGRPEIIAGVARIIVRADFLFTATVVIAQPISPRALVMAPPGLDRLVGRALFFHWFSCRCGCVILQ
jgi:uncharacterized membrane protein